MEIKIATSQEDLHKVYDLRYQVYIEEEQKFGALKFAEKMLKDEYDDHSGTVNLLMLIDGEAIGTVRVTRANKEGDKLPSDRLYNFDAVRKNHEGFIPGNIGMLAMRLAYRTPKAFTTLMLALGKLLLNNKQNYYMFTLNHECSKLFCRIMGAEQLATKFWSSEIGNYIIPMLLYKHQVSQYVKRFDRQEAHTYAMTL